MGWPFESWVTDRTHQWPLQELDHIARAPHLFETPLHPGAIIASGDENDQVTPLVPETPFCESVVAEPNWVPAPFKRLRIDPVWDPIREHPRLQAWVAN